MCEDDDVQSELLKLSKEENDPQPRRNSIIYTSFFINSPSVESVFCYDKHGKESKILRIDPI